MKKMRMETIEMIMRLTGMPLEDGIKLAFKTLDDTYAAFPRLEKPEFVILNGKEYPRPTN
jgi:hypothetical protein